MYVCTSKQTHKCCLITKALDQQFDCNTTHLLGTNWVNCLTDGTKSKRNNNY